MAADFWSHAPGSVVLGSLRESLTMASVNLNGDITINAKFVTEVFVEHRHYMNGSDIVLVVKMADGTRHQVRHGYGFDAYKKRGEIAAAMGS
jgi:hypothetical protein